MSIITKFFGTHSDRELKRIIPLVDKMEALRPEMMKLSEDLRAAGINLKSLAIIESAEPGNIVFRDED